MMESAVTGLYAYFAGDRSRSHKFSTSLKVLVIWISVFL
jgi:hypothetical protein